MAYSKQKNKKPAKPKARIHKHRVPPVIWEFHPWEPAVEGYCVFYDPGVPGVDYAALLKTERMSDGTMQVLSIKHSLPKPSGKVKGEFNHEPEFQDLP